MGQVMIPSFHRPSAIRIDPTNGYYDWGGPTNTTPVWNDSASRILRPRAADGHDASTFPDLVPGANGQITYDVDNDGDGITDSVWVDLGYPARRNAQGQLYKPLFAFMVIGLNGRIPLNTAGNLAGQVAESPFPCHRPPRTPTAAARHTRRTWATRSARSIRHTRCRTAMTRTTTPPGPSTIPPRTPPSIPRWTTPASMSA